MLWIVDQFEEVFTLCRDESGRGRFLGNLVYAALVPGGRNLVVLALRADFSASARRFRSWLRRWRDSISWLARWTPGTPRDDRRARVARRLNESRLAGVILEDVANEPGALPLLEHALWNVEPAPGKSADARRLPRERGVQSAIARRVEGIYAAFGRGADDRAANHAAADAARRRHGRHRRRAAMDG